MNESIKYQLKEMALEMIQDGFDRGGKSEAIKSVKDAVKSGFNEAIEECGASENDLNSWIRSWKFKN